MDCSERVTFTIFLVIMIVFVGKVYTQNDVVVSLGTDDPFQCYSKLRLRCTYTGTPATCCDGAKAWTADGAALTIGTSAESKYTQETFNGSDYFNLVINNLETSDLDKEYTCQYNIDSSLLAYQPNGDFHCNKCGGYGYLWAFIGVVVAAVFSFGVFYMKCLDKPKLTLKQLLVILLISVLISLVVMAVIPVPVCIVKYLCLKSPRYDPLFSILGAGFEGVLFVLICFCYSKCNPPKGSGGADSSSSRPPQGVRRPEIRESAQAGAHKRTENSSPKKNEYASKLDSVPKDRPLPQIGDDSPRPLPQLDQGKSNVPRLDPLGVTEDSGEKKKKKKKRKKQQENDEV